MVAFRITPDYALDQVRELIQISLQELGIDLSGDRVYVPADLADLADALDAADVNDALVRVDAAFAAHYGEAILETPHDELGVGRVAATWRLVKAAMRDSYS